MQLPTTSNNNLTNQFSEKALNNNQLNAIKGGAPFTITSWNQEEGDD